MTTYRLNLTGEYEGRVLADCANVRLQLPDGGTVTVPVELATEVKPPLPPEPPVRSVRQGGDCLWIHLSEGWYDAWGVHNPQPRQPRPWAWLVETFGDGLVPLVPDPADDAPALPWTLDSCRRSASVGTPKHGTVVVDVPGIDYTPGELEQIARALLAAARAAREVEQP